MRKPIVGITGDIDKGKYSVKMFYADAVESEGACPIFLSPSSIKDTIKGIAWTIDALLIPGGRDINPAFYGNPPLPPFTKGWKGGLRLVSPKRFYFEKTLLKEIMLLKKPILGICYGMQFLNVFLGGTLYHDLARQKPDAINHKSRHGIKIYNSSRLYYIVDRENIRVNSTHHQGIKKLGRGLIISACSRDNLIEAIELKNYPYFIGVQWHPERLLNRHSQKLFKSFVSAFRTEGKASQVES